MDREELNERARRLVLASPAISAALGRGDFRSLFHGRGLDFDSLREYSPGEDARLIDWNATARQDRPYVRVWKDDRSLTLFLLVDHSASMDEGSGELSKLDSAILSAALLGRAATLRDMPVGGIHFGRDVFARLEPRRGRAADLVFAAMTAEDAPATPARNAGIEGRPAGLAGALDAASRMLKRRSLVVILSDWRSRSWRDPLALLARNHDVVAVRIRDRLEDGLAGTGAFGLVDAGSGEAARISVSSPRARREWTAFWAKDAERIRLAFSECRVASLELDTAQDPALRFLEFFDLRRRRLG